jgi:hypothetical protein
LSRKTKPINDFPDPYGGYTPSKDLISPKYKNPTSRRKEIEKYKKAINAAKMTNNSNIWKTNYNITSVDISPTHTIVAANDKVRTYVPLEVQGRDVLKELDEMRDALLLLKRDVDLEEKYPRLKELKDEYEATLAKYKTFETIKNSK